MKRLFFNASVGQMSLEVLIITALIFSLSLTSSPELVLTWPLFGLTGCVAWVALRLQTTPTLSWHLVGLDFILGFIWTGILLMLFASLSILFNFVGLLIVSLPSPDLYEASLVFGFFYALFLGVRIGLRIVIMWFRIRQKRFIWSLTHSILLSALLVSMPFILFIVWAAIAPPTQINLSTTELIVRIVPVIGLLLVGTVILLIVVLPAALAVAYFAAKRLTKRIESLSGAASAVRAGNYTTRIEVEGQDEIAELQRTFNAMSTDLEQTVQNLKKERDAVATLLEARRTLIASVSHELRTPVATLRGYLDVALEQNTPEPQDLATMQRETIRLQGLIDDLFTLSRAEVQHLDIRLQPTDIQQIVQRCVETVAPTAWRSSKVDVLFGDDPQVAIANVDVGRLEQIVYNLLHNAIRHTAPGGMVLARVHTSETAVILEVRDTGEGIDPEELPHIWERFYRAHTSKSGTGLGLALVKELSEAMGGTVAVTSVVGEGSVFSVTFPIHESAQIITTNLHES